MTPTPLPFRLASWTFPGLILHSYSWPFLMPPRLTVMVVYGDDDSVFTFWLN
jgi:hypothetical protein